MPYRIIHEDGTEANGTLDHDGKTAKMQYLSQGTATIHFGDRPGLEEELQDERKQLKKYLDNILAKTRAYAKAHPDKIADENEYERLLTENLAFARGLGIGAVKLVKGTASGVAHLFKIAAMDVRESADTIDGDNQDYNKVAKEETAQGRAIVTNIEKGKHLLELVYEDQPTRSMLQKFAEEYYLSETPMMIAKEAGEAAGGLIPGILVALMLGSPELVPAEVASETGADISGVAAVANRMARTLKELKQTKDVEQAEVDQVHVLKAHEAILAKYMEEVETLDVTSPKNGAVFYSGPGNRKLAETFAEQPGMTTLEITPGGSYLDGEELFDQLPRHMAITPWRRLSERYAQQAFGKVYAFTKGATDTGVFNQYELPSLLSNHNVTDIIYKEEIGGTGDE